jgi:hypothetical protein
MRRTAEVAMSLYTKAAIVVVQGAASVLVPQKRSFPCPETTLERCVSMPGGRSGLGRLEEVVSCVPYVSCWCWR